MAKVRKLYPSLFLRYPTAFSQNTFVLKKWLSFIPKALEILTNKFSGLLNTMAIVFSTPENLRVEITGALEAQESHFLS